MRMEIETDLKEDTKKLLTLHPEWAPLLLSCVQLSRESAHGVLDGLAVRNRAQMSGCSLVPLRSFGILEKGGPAYKRGHVGIYRIRDVQAVEDALTELGYDVHAKLPGDFFAQHEKWLHRASELKTA
jgi:hypothetical protein